MSDTPRMDLALRKAQEDCTESYLLTEGLKLERELNEANDRIKLLEEDLMDAKNKHAALVADVALYEDRGERIKRLEEALAWYGHTVSNCYCHGSEGDAARDALRKDQGRKAKEAKP